MVMNRSSASVRVIVDHTVRTTNWNNAYTHQGFDATWYCIAATIPLTPEAMFERDELGIV